MDNVFSDLEQMVEALTGPLGDYAPRRRHLMVFPVFHEAAQSQVAVAFKNVSESWYSIRTSSISFSPVGLSISSTWRRP